jgi:hypothetical protein
MVLAFSHQLVQRAEIEMLAGVRSCPSLLSEIHQEVGHVASVLGTFPHLCYAPRSLAKFRLELEQRRYKYLARLKDSRSSIQQFI